MQDYGYRVQLNDDPDGGFLVQCIDIPELITSGEDRTEALWMARDALYVALTCYFDDGRPLPEAKASEGDMVYPIVSDCLKLAAMEAYRKSGLSVSAFSERVGVSPKDLKAVLDWGVESKSEAAERILMMQGHKAHLSVEAA